MELQQLKYFKTVAELGKISAAAEAMFVSAPALSTSIARLEKELGMPLFDRTNNRILLNKQGQIFLRYVNQVFNSLECAGTELRQSLLMQERNISVATVMSNMWIDLITAFSQEHPEFTLSCANYRRNQLDSVGLGEHHSFLLACNEDLNPYHLDKLESVPLFVDRLAVMMPPQHPLASLSAVTPEQLCSENLFFPLESNSLYKWVCNALEGSGIAMPGVNTCSYLMYRHMVEEGMGLSFTSLRASRLESPNLRYIPLDSPEQWQMRLYWRKNAVLTEDEECFRNFVLHFYGLH